MIKILLTFLLIAPCMVAMEQSEADYKLLKSIAGDDVKYLKDFLSGEMGVDVNARYDRICSGLTLLIFAARHGAINCATHLIEEGADVKIINGENMEFGSPLHYACEYGHEEMVELLLDNGADINSRNFKNQTPLCSAANGGYSDIVNYLLQEGALVNPEAEESSPEDVKVFRTHTFYHGWAIESHQFDNKGSSSPLCSAIVNGDYDMAELLIEHNVDVRHLWHGKISLLYVAYGMGNGKIVELLRDNGLTLIDEKSVHENIPGLLAAAIEDNSLSRVKVHIQSGLDLEEVDKFETTPLIRAANSGYVEMVKELLFAGANNKALAKNGKTALDYARFQRDKLIKSLVSHVEKLCDNNIVKNVEHYREFVTLNEKRIPFDDSIDLLEHHQKKLLPLKYQCINMIRGLVKDGTLNNEDISKLDEFGFQYVIAPLEEVENNNNEEIGYFGTVLSYLFGD